ncbi:MULTISPECIES: DUF6209 family protein [unclassified Moorena]|uniref:DUF6209 family protein n=1 Tax=unclassified Moorena TaxID=2683338 RepID=UPI0013C7C9B8|nr:MULTISPECIES: DUF6209 family protein [unclassified Moorena]NEO22157.1 hypothetical protein [Moorena sp. SIO4A5]NEQ60262.1 hypothetical protein [Moorena sp. SIO4A1]
MQKLRNALLALVIAIALTWMPSFTVASAQAQDAPDLHPGLQFALDPYTLDFVQFQSGEIEPGHEVHVFYDSQRLLEPANPYGCTDFESLKVTAHAECGWGSGSTESDLEALDCLECGVDCDGVVDFVKVGDFTPECDYLEIWFSGKDSTGGQCIDNNYGQNYTFPVYW